MNAVVKLPAQPKQMLLDVMADRAGLRPQEFADTVRATCGMGKASAEEFAAFLMVAKEYNLNPLTKEIYAFPAKGGGIVPVVSIDGWVNLVNSHPACDGFEFDVEHDDKGELVSITCRMFRKDRSRPVVVTEYYEECKRGTDPWKMKHRMLRHKSMIQAARYAFGFSGIYDEDEGAKIAEMRDVTPMSPPSPPRAPSPPSAQISASVDEPIIEHEQVVEETGEAIEAIQDGEVFDIETFLSELDDSMATASSHDAVIEVWDGYDVEATLCDDEAALQRAFDLRKPHIARVLRAEIASHPVNAG